MERKIDRLDKYLRLKGLNDNKISVQLGLSVGILGKSRKPGKDLSAKTIEIILRNFNDLNPTWLLTGEGEMLTIEECKKQLPEDITISREVFDLISSQQKTIVMQQETILILQKSPGGELM